MYKVWEERESYWFNGRAKQQKEEIKLEKKEKNNTENRTYRLPINEHVRIRRDEQKYENYKIEKCKNEPELIFQAHEAQESMVT